MVDLAAGASSRIPLGQLAGLVESLLFVAPDPVQLTALADALEEPLERIEEALAHLADLQHDRGVQVQRARDRVQLVSSPEAAPYIERFLGLDLVVKLSPAALETLAIIAYRQPVTRAQIDEWRGVNSDGVLRTLLHRGLVEQGERLEQAGRPFHYHTTFDFLQHFGLQSLDDLPPLMDDSETNQTEEETPVNGEPLEEISENLT
ncbi:MAG: SMC-Scp complex subunit ScpB [Anaerolineae bacterium]|nr:SMC-Scp complex subunit ScpB [Anaerolineae bacterium]MCB9131523.1 SMC-Scp complex subunit ScpB [Anaerolineales bacterium]MCB0229766.1 SMC-Scp complex subunit ScpB [Anaerolineae bacterium]MCB0235755.1 SMC-Scp complex subunit ScpB [Anaerolineae bacterium]MCB0239547.1 SMC-Scp complex subunit ScpB [Anaerolineae bacterium]